MKGRLLFFFIFIAICVNGSNSNTDSLFFKSFNKRYQNPKEGIRLAKELIPYAPHKAYISLAYNYFFLSNYDSTLYYIDKINSSKRGDELIFNLARTCRGYVELRRCRYYEAYNNFEAVEEFYQIDEAIKTKDEKLFVQGLIINSLGKITLQYYYANDFEKIDNDLKSLLRYAKKFEPLVPADIFSHIQYAFVENYSKNPKEINNSVGFRDHLIEYFKTVNETTYYRTGNIFEILGNSYKKQYQTYFKDSILPFIGNAKFDKIIGQIIANSQSPQLDFFKISQSYFKKHGDLYPIAVSYCHIASYYYEKISGKEKVDRSFLDSLYKYCNLSLRLFESKDSAYFNRVRKKVDTNFLEDSLEQFTSKLISVPWYINALKLEETYHIYAGSDWKKIKKLRILIKELEEWDRRNVKEFYTSMEDALNKRIKIEKERIELGEKKDRQSVIFGLIILFATVTIFIIVILYRREKLQWLNDKLSTIQESEKVLHKSKERLEEWNTVISEIFAIKEQLLQDEKAPITEIFKKLNSLLLKYFDAEYCAIGIYGQDKLIDIAHNFDYEIDDNKKEKFVLLANLPSEETIIGKFLSNGENYIKYEREKIDLIRNSHLKIYESLLRTRILNSIDLFGIYGTKDGEMQKTKIGYINFINRKKGSDSEFLTNMNQLIAQIKVILESKEERLRYRNRINDEKFINGLIDGKLSINDIIVKSIDYFTNEFNAGIVSFRVPVISGPDENPDENLKLVLRNHWVDPAIPNASMIDQFYYTDKKILSLSDITYRDVMLNNFPDDVFLSEIGQNESFYTRFELHNIFDSKINILFPIRKMFPRVDENDGMNTYWRNLYGVFNLQPYELRNFVDIKERLKFLSLNIAYVVNSIIDRKKYLQISSLHREVSNLYYEQLDSFYDQIAKMVKTVINAEICSIFIFNNYNNRLELKATTAKKVKCHGESINVSDIKYKDDIYYDSNDLNSVTLSTYKENKTYMIYSLNSYRNTSGKFTELSESGDEIGSSNFSRLFVPLKNFDSNQNPIGVIKCLGSRVIEENLIHSFWDFDRETLEFVSALAARFIVNAQLNNDKDDFIRQVVHETTSPITEMLHKQVEYYNRLKRNNLLPKGFDEYQNSMVNNIMLQKHILADLSDVSMYKSELMVINPSMENTKKLLLEVVKLLEENAASEKGISIKSNISILPDLLLDRSKMQQVFINLLKNAINYSHKNTIIQIFYRLVDKHQEPFTNTKWHEIRFVNDGIGIPENEIRNIFLLYRRGSNAGKKRPSGTGIGLFLVDQIVKAHGGFCKVIRADNPTEISIYLPAK